MWEIASVLNAVCGVLLAPLRPLHPLAALAAVAVPAGVLMLLLFGRASNQRAIHGAKSRLKAHIAEIWLFRDDLLQMLLATLRVLAHTGRYFAHSLRPLLFILPPMLLLLVGLGVRYEHRPFLPGERAILAAKVKDPAWLEEGRVRLAGAEGCAVISPALRIPGRLQEGEGRSPGGRSLEPPGEVNWLIEARAPGRHELVLETPAGEVAKRVIVARDAGDAGKALPPQAPGRGAAFSGRFLQFPGEPPLPSDSGLQWIDVVGWPKRELTFLGLGVHWLVVFFVVSLAAALAVKDLFGVEV